MARAFKVHAERACCLVHPTPLCGSSGWRRISQEPDEVEGEVTCLICLYHMGRYMPLSKRTLPPLLTVYVDPAWVKMMTERPLAARLYDK